jgi:beta-glucanase (GH16 family)
MYKKGLSGSVLVILFSICLLLLFSCTKGSDPGPGLSITDAVQVRNTTETSMQFRLILTKTAGNEVSVDYSFSDGTAKAPSDYISITGTVIIHANQTEGTITVRLPGDPLNVRQANLQFTVNLSNPKFCTIVTPSAKGIIVTEDGTYLTIDNKGYSTPLVYPGYTLVWSDEFSGNSLDLSAWNQETGTGSGGWGNNELETYTNSLKNTFVSNGNLIIEARRENIGASSYSSGRMTTQNKKVFKFGRIDIRAKLPAGKGIWPALWMLGINISSAGWPASGEIDIMELLGSDPTFVYGTLHWSSISGSHASKGAHYILPSGNFSKEFHVFSIVWGENFIQWFVDDNKYLDISISDPGVAPYPFNASQFFIFNVAVGGNWPGMPDNTTEFPQRMFVDYVRVFQ